MRQFFRKRLTLALAGVVLIGAFSLIMGFRSSGSTQQQSFVGADASAPTATVATDSSSSTTPPVTDQSGTSTPVLVGPTRTPTHTAPTRTPTTPAGTATATPSIGQTTTLSGAVSVINLGAGTFTIDSSSAPIVVTGSTQWQGVSGLSALRTGMSVRVTGSFQTDGTFNATQVIVNTDN